MSQLTEQLQISHEFWQLCGGMVNVSCCIRHPKLINQKVVLEKKKAKKNSNQSFQTDSVQHHTAPPRRVVPASQTSIFVSISRESSNLHLELLTREKLEGGSSLENSARRQLTEVISTSNFVLNLRASVC